jgi:predicted nuclease with TOPRIM domain
MSFNLATFLSKLVPNQHELQRLVQLRQLNNDTEAAREALDNLATEVAAQNECHEQIFASIEDLKGRLADAA